MATEQFADPWEALYNKIEFTGVMWNTFLVDGDDEPYVTEDGKKFPSFYDYTEYVKVWMAYER